MPVQAKIGNYCLHRRVQVGAAHEAAVECEDAEAALLVGCGDEAEALAAEDCGHTTGWGKLRCQEGSHRLCLVESQRMKVRDSTDRTLEECDGQLRTEERTGIGDGNFVSGRRLGTAQAQEAARDSLTHLALCCALDDRRHNLGCAASRCLSERFSPHCDAGNKFREGGPARGTESHRFLPARSLQSKIELLFGSICSRADSLQHLNKGNGPIRVSCCVGNGH